MALEKEMKRGPWDILPNPLHDRYPNTRYEVYEQAVDILRKRVDQLEERVAKLEFLVELHQNILRLLDERDNT